MMRLVSFVHAGVTRAGVIVDECVVDLAAAYAAIPCNKREARSICPPT